MCSGVNRVKEVSNSNWYGFQFSRMYFILKEMSPGASGGCIDSARRLWRIRMKRWNPSERRRISVPLPPPPPRFHFINRRADEQAIEFYSGPCRWKHHFLFFCSLILIIFLSLIPASTQTFPWIGLEAVRKRGASFALPGHRFSLILFRFRKQSWWCPLWDSYRPGSFVLEKKTLDIMSSSGKWSDCCWARFIFQKCTKNP